MKNLLLLLIITIISFSYTEGQTQPSDKIVTKLNLKSVESNTYIGVAYFTPTSHAVGYPGWAFLDIISSISDVEPEDIKYIRFSNYVEPSNMQWERQYINNVSAPLSNGLKYTAAQHDGEWKFCFRPTQIIDYVWISSTSLYIIYDDLPYIVSVDVIVERNDGTFSETCTIYWYCFKAT